MNFATVSLPFRSIKSDLLIVRVFEGEKKLDPLIAKLDTELNGMISEVVGTKAFSGKARELVTLYSGKKIRTPWVVIVGLGKKSEFDLERSRQAAAAVVPLLQKHQAKTATFLLTKSLPQSATAAQATTAIVEGVILGNYRFVELKSKEADQPAPLSTIHFLTNNSADRGPVLKGAQRGMVIASAVNFSRDLANRPGNLMTPKALANEATKLAKQEKLKCKILDRPEIARLGMNAFLAVNQGSEEPPKFIILEYSPRSAGGAGRGKKSGSPVVLVGKGITFDSGGISLKPGKNMEEMKFDMSGGAAVLGIMKAAAELKLPLQLVALIPATENLPSGRAIKPGDVVRAMSGKTIEVVNTDAEGRMILSDALAYAARYHPRLVVDFATLTGACVVALGTDYSGAFSNNQKLLADLQRAGEKTGEKIWPLPLAQEYKEQIKSHVADLKNVGNEGQGAGTITGALFLQEFVSYPWIHLDIAGTAWTTADKPYKPKGATGAGVRMTIELLSTKS